MKCETDPFVTSIFREDHSILDMLTANYTAHQNGDHPGPAHETRRHSRTRSERARAGGVILADYFER